MVMDSRIKEIIDQVIINDEGGWKLTENANDPDGGWTFAGVTSKTWNGIPENRGLYTYSDAAHYIVSDIDNFRDEIYEIYYKEYYVKVFGTVSIDNINPAIFSCAVNCSVEIASELRTESMYDHNKFLTLWHYHYIDLVKKNAEAWRDFALDSKKAVNNSEYAPTVKEPTTLRAENLKGWFNRVERYRNT